MTPYRIAVVDDLERDRAWLAEKLADYMARERLEYELTAFASGEAFSAALEQGQRFNLVFMDIYMDGITGIEAAQTLRARDMDCKLVFLTTSEDFMRQGFSLNSAHYLIKPVKDEDFAQAMANCRLGRALQVPTLAVTVEGRTLEVDTRQIRYLEVQQRSVVLHTTRGDLPLGRSFSAAAAPLERDRRFLLCFKGVLVNMDHIAAQTGDELRLDDGSILPIAPRRRREIRDVHIFREKLANKKIFLRLLSMQKNVSLRVKSKPVKSSADLPMRRFWLWQIKL